MAREVSPKTRYGRLVAVQQRGKLLSTSLLLNLLYHKPTGHVLEALKYAKGYHDANKGLRIEVLLNSESPIELVSACDWIERAHSISVREVLKHGPEARCLHGIPRNWNFVIASSRFTGQEREQLAKELVAAHDVLAQTFRATDASGYTPPFSLFDERNKLGEQVIPYTLNAPIRLRVPQRDRTVIDRHNRGGCRICILPTGSSGANSPSVAMWRRICQTLSGSIPNVQLYFTGITRATVDRLTSKTANQPASRRPITGALTRREVRRLVAGLASAHDCFNIGLWNQLALVESCDLLIAPHTGFAFLAPCVGTPWLAVSACPWHEYFFNDVPFASIFPDCGSYPAQVSMEEDCGRLLAQGRRSICATDPYVEARIPEIVEAATQLTSGLDFVEALRAHLRRIETANVITERFEFFDGMGDWNEKLTVAPSGS